MRCPKFQFIEQFIFTFSQTPEIFFWWLLTNNLLWTKKNIFLSHWLAFLCKYYLVLNTQTTWVRRINKYLLKLFYQFPLVIEPINMAIGGEWGSAAPSLKYNTIVYIARWTSVISEEVCDMGSYSTSTIQIVLCRVR